MKIITHPANLEPLKKRCELGAYDAPFGIEIVVSKYIDRDRPTGRYILPDGSAVAKKGFRMPWGRFAEFTESDIPALLWWGMIKEQREPFFYVIDDRKLWSFLSDLSMPFCKMPKWLLGSCV